ncbi:MAG: type II toxin-antitoxin system RatA family toxin [Rhodospirillaceae bacterium]|jgi:coenzyme Q-binding protein COQ10|nr:type II toxin-antitoxin system RatA family toxin [Rhodospirillaceae bacterium]MBT4219209.1 type II toxin-antitoxin system RatA family toxin [Rhodospirillaceae bacterium]MBT4465028.1 type II toxin-antitoxin system RatA family toxin [Rhodospirillaceae bacterium]MBT5014542.1 type II toxin-antitoxin system RatA family toxin [Rhodospirillaceae bacterium]MBT5309270.1 type II toxin-antitoxin system RatA family toxin [Rhodospirillaceae bacterium]
MGRYREQRREPYTAEHLYDIAVDIESYPTFVPMFVAARITQRDDNRLRVDNVLGAGPLRFRILTEATFEEPLKIDIVSVDGDGGDLSISWQFDAVDDTSTTVTLEINHQFNSPLMTSLSELLSNGMERRILNAFEKRAHQLYGPGST